MGRPGDRRITVLLAGIWKRASHPVDSCLYTFSRGKRLENPWISTTVSNASGYTSSSRECRMCSIATYLLSLSPRLSPWVRARSKGTHPQNGRPPGKNPLAIRNPDGTPVPTSAGQIGYPPPTAADQKRDDVPRRTVWRSVHGSRSSFRTAPRPGFRVDVRQNHRSACFGEVAGNGVADTRRRSNHDERVIGKGEGDRAHRRITRKPAAIPVLRLVMPTRPRGCAPADHRATSRLRPCKPAPETPSS